MTAGFELLCKTLLCCSMQRYSSDSVKLYRHCVIFIFDILNLIDVCFRNLYLSPPGLNNNNKKGLILFLSPQQGNPMFHLKLRLRLKTPTRTIPPFKRQISNFFIVLASNCLSLLARRLESLVLKTAALIKRDPRVECASEAQALEPPCECV